MSQPTPESDGRGDLVGTVYLPMTGTDVGTFQFILDQQAGTNIQIGTPVTAHTDEGPVIGFVNDMQTVGTEQNPVRSDLGGPDRIKTLNEVQVATVQVAASDKLRSVRYGQVHAATAEDVAAATGVDRVEWPVPMGVVELNNGDYAKVSAAGRSLLGPDAAHLMVGGLSGQAAKSSFMGVLLKAAVAAGSHQQDSVAALIFNVKGTDYLFMDEPPAGGKYQLTDDDRTMYDALGVPAEPFDDVTVYAPSLPGGAGTHSLRHDAMPLQWSMGDIWNNLDFVYPWLWDDEKFRAFLDTFGNEHIYTRNHRNRIDNFADLERWLDDKVSNDDHWRGIHPATLGRMRRQICSLPEQYRGLLARNLSSGSGTDIPVDVFSHGQVVVVDIAGQPQNVQALVIARTLKRLLRQAEDASLGVDHLVVMSDELNAFAPAQGGDMKTIRRILKDISTQGRYAGMSLWGAAQMLSKVDELVRDNAATRALGVTSDGELASGPYGRMSAGLTERVATLPKGQMAVWHQAAFRGAVVVKFPRPAWQTGKAERANTTAATNGSNAAAGRTGGNGQGPNVKAERTGPAEILEIPQARFERLTEGIPTDVVERIIADAGSRDDALEQLQAHRVPDMKREALHAPTTATPDDPFALDDMDLTNDDDS